MTAIELRDVTAGYDGVAVLRDVTLNVQAGEVVALLGANGAGKTTTVRAVCGLAAVHRGSVHVLGTDVTSAAPRTRARHGLATVADVRGVFTQLTVAENLRIGRPSGADLESWFPDLARLLARPAGVLSGGEQTLLALARAMVSRPGALVVDELTTGLAAGLAEAALLILRRAAREWGTAVLLAEQSAHLALAHSDRAAVLRRGRVVLEGTPAEIARQPDALAATYLGELD